MHPGSGRGPRGASPGSEWCPPRSGHLSRRRMLPLPQPIRRLMRMDEALARAQALVDEYAQELASALPREAEIFDAHVHLGQDIDGFSGSYDDLMALNERYGISRCFMFCLDEPDRHPAFRAANDRTLAYAKRSGGTPIPFVRLDLAEPPIEAAILSLDLPAPGLTPP